MLKAQLNIAPQSIFPCRSSPGLYHRHFPDRASRQDRFVRIDRDQSPSFAVLRREVHLCDCLSSTKRSKDQSYKAEFNNRSECSLNFRINGSAPFCRPACIVTSLATGALAGFRLAHLLRSKFTYSAMIFLGSCEIGIQWYFFDPLISGLKFYTKMSRLVSQDAGTDNAPSSSLRRYLSKIASSLTTC